MHIFKYTAPKKFSIYIFNVNSSAEYIPFITIDLNIEKENGKIEKSLGQSTIV